MSSPLPDVYLETIRSRAARANGSVLRRAEWPEDWVASPAVVLQLCDEIERMRAALKEIGREQSHVDATVAADRFQRLAREALSHEMMSVVLDEIRAERERQIEAEGWSADHDDGHKRGEMAAAAGCYALVSTWDHGAMFATVSRQPTRHGRNFGCIYVDHVFWPWDLEWWKPSEEPRRNLVKAAALLVAEIERLDRKQARESAGCVEDKP